jgi:hypothetical protein
LSTPKEQQALVLGGNLLRLLNKSGRRIGE